MSTHRRRSLFVCLALLAIAATLAASFFTQLPKGDPANDAAPEALRPVATNRSPKPKAHEADAGRDSNRESASASNSEPAEKDRWLAAVDAATSPLQLVIDSRGVAEVAFELTDSDDDVTRAPLFSGKTDATGRAELIVDFKLPDTPNRPSRLELWARVSQPGFQQRMSQVIWSKKYETWRARLRLEEGGTLRGRTLDSEGQPVAASISLWNAKPAGARTSKPHKPLADGWFEYHFGDLMTCDLVAKSWESGTGRLRGVTLDPEDPHRDLEIVLHGPGVLRGRIVDAHGAGVHGLGLSAQLAEPVAEGLREGNPTAFKATDEEGHFEMRALQAADYRIFASAHDPAAPPRELTQHPVPADGTPLWFRYGTPRLVVALVDASGAPWEEGIKHHADLRREEWDAWPEKPAVIVQACRESETPGYGFANSQFLAWTYAGGGHFAFELTPDRSYAVTTFGGPFAGPARTLTVDAAMGTERIEFRARKEGTEAKLRVRVEVDGVERTGREPDRPRFEVSIFDRNTSILVARRERSGNFKLGSGAHRVVVEGRSRTGGHFAAPAPRTLGPIEAFVDLQAGMERELTIQLRPGGVLSLAIHGEPNAGDRRAAQERHWSPLESAELESYASKAELWLHRPDRPPERVFATRDMTWCCGDWHLGKKDLSAALPSGPGELIARLPGGREVRRAVEVVAGETVEVEMSFPR